MSNPLNPDNQLFATSTDTKYDDGLDRRTALDVMSSTIQSELGCVQGKTVLDVGCGSGRSTMLLLDWGAEKVVGVDGNERLIAFAKQKQRHNPRAEFITCDITQLPHMGPFEAATAVSVLQYVSNHHEIMEILRRVYSNLSPGGVFVTSVVCFDKHVPLQGQAGLYGGLATEWVRTSLDEFAVVRVQTGNEMEPDIFNLYPETVEKAMKDVGFSNVSRSHLMADGRMVSKNPGVAEILRDWSFTHVFKGFKN